MSIGDRITERLDALDISQSELARRVKVSQPTINALIKGGAAGSKHLHVIAAELETSPAWLAGETDDPSPVAPRRSAIDALSDELDLAVLPEYDIGYGMGAGTSLAERYEQTGIVPFARTWLRSMMGGSIADLFVARGDGDSMEPTLFDGDIVLIDTAQQSIRKQDRIWAVIYGDLGMIKRVRRTPSGSYLLLSDNPKVPPVECFDGEHGRDRARRLGREAHLVEWLIFFAVIVVGWAIIYQIRESADKVCRHLDSIEQQIRGK